jgi:hypothetical protein
MTSINYQINNNNQFSNHQWIVSIKVIVILTIIIFNKGIHI